MLLDKGNEMAQNQRNYQKEMEKITKGLQGNRKSLFLHSCCAPCSSYVLEYLTNYFEITILFYNPNITKEEEKMINETKSMINR